MKKFLKKLHLYFALVLCAPLIIQGLTGSLLVFQREISDAILQRKYDLVAGENADDRLLIEKASESVPAEFVFQSVKISAAATLRFSKNGEKKEWLEVLLDPVSGELLEVRDPNKNFFRVLKKFHESLLLPGRVGKNIVGIFGIVLLLMCVSGLVIWWPKKGNLKRALTFKFSSVGKKFHRDLHGAVGFWMLIPLASASITGIYLIYFKTKESNKLWHTIHEGAVGGLTWQLVVFLAGFLPLLFSVTGIWLWLLKKRDRKAKILG